MGCNRRQVELLETSRVKDFRGEIPLYALVSELVDEPDLGSGAEMCESSSLSESTMIKLEKWEKLRAGHTAKPKIRVVVSYFSPGDGNGDWAYNTCREIIDRNEKGAFAHMALEEVFRVLSEGKRWADYMIPFISSGMHNQYNMTQDPWILAYCCAVHLDRLDLIEQYKPSMWLFNLPDKWAWRRALLGKSNLYWLWRIVTPHSWMQHFVYVFYGYMDKAYLESK